MTRIKFRWIILLIVLAGAGVFAWHYTRPTPISIVVRPVEKGSVEKTASNTRAGTVNACRRAKLSPGIGGQITKLLVKEGDRVAKGQLLLELWNKDLMEEVLFAGREVDAMAARSRAACTRAQIAQRDARRMEELYRTNAVSFEKMDRAVTESKAITSECTAASVSVLMSRTRVEVISANLERTRLIAPFNGVIAEINGELNEYVTPSPVGIPTPPAIDLVDNTCFYVAAPIDEVDAPLIRKGMAARISLDAFQDKHYGGKVRRVGVFVVDREKQARTVDVEVEFANPSDMEILLAGYSADVEILLQVHPDTLRIPTEAILDGNRVFVFRPDSGMIQEKIIVPGISNWDFTQVLSGLENTDQVVVNVDQAGVKDGVKGVVSGESR
ncbi:MAG: efflux RND transporter periplasmic adaptor subunit [Proteobacteria bacterium]|nr:efflux RND transporter periplasmic adaptor subunit [Pseudomonadota bacterium]